MHFGNEHSDEGEGVDEDVEEIAISQTVCFSIDISEKKG